MPNTLSNLTPADTPAIWYKQFWPWFLIILPGTVVIASLITVVIAFKSADTLVVDNYYKEGLAINQTFTEIDNAKSLNINGTITIDNTQVNLTISGNSAIDEDEILLTFSHPMDNRQDISLNMQSAGNGLYRASMPKAAAGKWYMALHASNTTSPWTVNKTVFLPAPTIEFSAK